MRVIFINLTSVLPTPDIHVNLSCRMSAPPSPPLPLPPAGYVCNQMTLNFNAAMNFD